jgi:hypothetical protein
MVVFHGVGGGTRGRVTECRDHAGEGSWRSSEQENLRRTPHEPRKYLALQVFAENEARNNRNGYERHKGAKSC